MRFAPFAAAADEGATRFVITVSATSRRPSPSPTTFAPRGAGPADEGGLGLVELEPGRLWVDREFVPEFERLGLVRLRAVMDYRAGECLRALPDRENWRLTLLAGAAPRGAYLKKHHGRSVGSWWRAKWGGGPGATAGRAEAANVVRLQRGGIGSMRLVAFGEGLRADGLVESFVITEELAGFVPLDDFLKAEFARRPAGAAAPHRAARRQLLAQAAEVARRFHAQGYNHRDFYCCHLFVRERPGDGFDVRLIDLQRVDFRRRFRSRWLVKDLAQLAYSAPRDRVSCTDRMFFLKTYLGVERLGAAEKRLARRVFAKARRMERRLGAHP